MKTLTTIVAFIVMVFTLALPAFAATASTPAFNVNASVDGALSITATLFKDSATGPTGSSIAAINFGQLQVFTNTSTGGQTLRSSDTGTGAVMGGAVALVSANSHGAHYVITQTGTALTSGTNTIPIGACRMVPFYSTGDLLGGVAQGAAPAGAVPSTTKASWVTTGGPANTLYNSEVSPTQVRVMQAHFSVSDDPATGSSTAVPTNQPGGTYGPASITFTVVSP